MQSVVGIFRSPSAAKETMERLIDRGIKRESIIFLSLESPQKKTSANTEEKQLDRIPTTDAESDGIGAAVGALVGGGVGASTGLAGGAAVASLLVPGVGMIFAIGLGAAAVLGLGGAAAGAKIGDATEHASDTGIPKDDVFFYRDLLRKGRSLVIANLDGDDRARVANDVIREHGGESVESARKEWNPAA